MAARVDRVGFSDAGRTMTESREHPCAQRLRVLRARRGATQEDVASAVGVSQNAVGKWERGESQPQADELVRLADFYDVAIDFICGRCDAPSGLDAGSWLIDLDEVDQPRDGKLWCVQVPRRARIVDYDEMRRIETETEARRRRKGK